MKKLLFLALCSINFVSFSSDNAPAATTASVGIPAHLRAAETNSLNLRRRALRNRIQQQPTPPPVNIAASQEPSIHQN